MRYYRIMSELFYKSPYSSSSNGGRWNPRGSRMIYAGSSPSVSLLEYLSVKGSAVGLNPWYMVIFEIENEKLIGTLDAKELPTSWNSLPHGRATQNFGQTWLHERAFPFLRVPSSRLNIKFYPLEHNLLINPDFAKIEKNLKVVDTVPFSYLLG